MTDTRTHWGWWDDDRHQFQRFTADLRAGEDGAEEAHRIGGHVSRREAALGAYIISIPGKGSYANIRTQVDEGRKRELLAEMDEIVTELLFLGVTADELDRRIRGKEAAANEG